MADAADMWRSGFLRWRAVWVRKDGGLAVNMNRYAARSFEGYDPEKARADAAASQPWWKDEWSGQTIVVQQAYPWDDDEAKELARKELAK